MTKNKLENVPFCPNEDCNKPLDGFTGVDHEHRPIVGDITVCGYCAWVLEFQEGLSLGVYQIGDFMALDAETQAGINKAQAAVIAMIETKKAVRH